MDKVNCERMITKHLKAIVKIYKRYNPDGKYLTMSYIDGAIEFNNTYWDEDISKPLDTHENI